MAKTYVLAAGKVAKMTEIGFLSTYGQAYRVLNHLPGSREESAKRIYELCKRHGDTVCKVVDGGISDHAPLLRAQQLPSTCLLSLVVSPIAKQPGYLDPAENEPKSTDQAMADPTRYVRRPIVFAIDDEQRCVRFFGGVRANGANYVLFKALGDRFRFHVENGSEKDGHEFVKWQRLTDDLGISQHTLRQRVRRCRRSLSSQFNEKLGWTLDRNEVIENDHWQGYRLNPHLLLVASSQLESEHDD
jgi:hypothetical protein